MVMAIKTKHDDDKGFTNATNTNRDQRDHYLETELSSDLGVDDDEGNDGNGNAIRNDAAPAQVESSSSNEESSEASMKNNNYDNNRGGDAAASPGGYDENDHGNLSGSDPTVEVETFERIDVGGLDGSMTHHSLHRLKEHLARPQDPQQSQQLPQQERQDELHLATKADVKAPPPPAETEGGDTAQDLNIIISATKQTLHAEAELVEWQSKHEGISASKSLEPGVDEEPEKEASLLANADLLRKEQRKKMLEAERLMREVEQLQKTDAEIIQRNKLNREDEAEESIAAFIGDTKWLGNVMTNSSRRDDAERTTAKSTLLSSSLSGDAIDAFSQQCGLVRNRRSNKPHQPSYHDPAIFQHPKTSQRPTCDGWHVARRRIMTLAAHPHWRRTLIMLIAALLPILDFIWSQNSLMTKSPMMNDTLQHHNLPSAPNTHPKTLKPKKQYRVLLTDIFFPISFAKWRIEEIYSFVEEYYTDILVTRTIYQMTQSLTFLPTFDKCESRFMLSKRYDILIFDPKWNVLNKFNGEGFDGTVYNGLFVGASYMLRRREFRDDVDLIWEKYDACYHIFLDLLTHFGRLPIPKDKQWVHLYPGGGLARAEDLYRIPPDVGLVVTQLPVFNWVQQLPNQNVVALGGSFLQQDSVMIPKPRRKSPEKIGICFTQASGDSKYKGDAFFEQAIREFAASYPILWNKTSVYTVGKASEISGLGIKSMGFMDQDDLDNFYQDHIDIYINTETGILLNGWPLGMEALLQGAVGIQTDAQNMNAGFNFTEEEMFIVPSQSAGVPHIVQALVKLTNDTDLLHSMSKRSQKKMHHILSYSNSQGKVFAAIDARIQASISRG